MQTSLHGPPRDTEYHLKRGKIVMKNCQNIADFSRKNNFCLSDALQREAVMHENRRLRIWGMYQIATNYVSFCYQLYSSDLNNRTKRDELCIKTQRSRIGCHGFLKRSFTKPRRAGFMIDPV
jgi:hypothetical protein